MTRTREHRALYGLLGAGVIATFFGHGMWAVRGKDSFITLLTSSLDNVFGYEMSVRSGETFVKVIGWFDVVVAIGMVALVVGALLERGLLYRAAYSPVAVTVWTWGVIWGFATAFSRMTANQFYPEVWDWVERAPNFVLPAALIYVIYRHRTLNVPTHVAAQTEYTTA